MRVKNIKIGIRTVDEALNEAKEVMTKLSKKEKVKKRTGIYFENLEGMRKVLTEKRLEVLHIIKKEHPASVYALAKSLGRDITNVTDDLNYLEDVGLVELKKTKEGRDRTTPTVNYDKIQIEIAV